MFPAAPKIAGSALRLLLVSVIFLSAGAASADGEDRSVSLLRRLQDHLHGLIDFRATFTQKLQAPHSTSSREESGILYVRMPGKMRWNYLEPERKEFVCDGEKIWFYEPEENAVTIFDAGAMIESGTPLQLLLGQGDLFSDFLVSGDDAFPSLSPGGVVALIQPREEDASFIRAHLEMTPGPAPRLVRLLIVDPLQNITEYRFSDFRENSGLSTDYFHFDPPPGTEVWEERVTIPETAGGGSPANSN